jgi:hypothetical protein
MLPLPALGQVKCGRCWSIVCSLLSPVGRIVFGVISERIYGVSASLLRGILVTHENQILNSLSHHTHTLHTYMHKYLPSFSASLVTHEKKILSHVTHTPSTRIHTCLPSCVLIAILTRTGVSADGNKGQQSFCHSCHSTAHAAVHSRARSDCLFELMFYMYLTRHQ